MEKEIFMILKYADFPMKYVEEKIFKTMYIDDGEYKGYLSQIEKFLSHGEENRI